MPVRSHKLQYYLLTLLRLLHSHFFLFARFLKNKNKKIAEARAR